MLLLLAALLLLAPSSPSSSLARVANGVAAHEHDHSAGGDHDHGADHGDDLGDINFDDAEIAEHDGDDAGEIVDGDDSDMDMELDPEMLHPEAKDGDYAVELEEGSDVDKVAKEANCQNIVGIWAPARISGSCFGKGEALESCVMETGHWARSEGTRTTCSLSAKGQGSNSKSAQTRELRAFWSFKKQGKTIPSRSARDVSSASQRLVLDVVAGSWRLPGIPLCSSRFSDSLVLFSVPSIFLVAQWVAILSV